jgi:Ca2+-binding RTX toxin-like protein
MVTRVGRGLAARSIGRSIATAAICVAGVLTAAAPAASANVACAYDASADVLNVTANEDDDAVILQTGGGGEIVVTHTEDGQAACTGGPPTVDNTDNINLLDLNAETTWFLADPETLVPGTGGEVETTVALGGGDDSFFLLDFNGTTDFWTAGALGINWSGDNDREVLFVGSLDQVGLGGEVGEDALNAQGGQGTGDPFTGPGTFGAAGGADDDVVWGGDAGDMLFGGTGNDELRGFAGGDSLEGDEGTNELFGGDGDDRASYLPSPGGVTVDLGVAGPQDTGLGTDTMSAVEGLEGSNQADVLIGNGEANALIGQDGDDTLDGRGGNDSLDGGAGVNTATYESAPAGVNVSLDAGTATGAAGDDTLTGVDDLIGSQFADTLIGSPVNNSITGLGGSDTVRAEGGADAVRVRDGGPDTADCGDGTDTATADAAGIDALTACEDVLSPPTGGGDAGEPDNAFTFGKVKKNKRKGTAKLTVNVPGPGDLELAKSKKMKGAEKRARSEGSVKLAVKPKGKAKEKLADTGKAKVNAEVTYTPDGGDPNTQSKQVKLVRRG